MLSCAAPPDMTQCCLGTETMVIIITGHTLPGRWGTTEVPSSDYGRNPNDIRKQRSTLLPRPAVCLMRACPACRAALRRARAPAPAPARAPAPAAAPEEAATAEAAAEAPAVYVTYNALPAQTEAALAPGVAPFGVGAPEARYGFAPLGSPLAQQVSPGLFLL